VNLRYINANYLKIPDDFVFYEKNDPKQSIHNSEIVTISILK
jgi:hypothetical protein